MATPRKTIPKPPPGPAPTPTGRAPKIGGGSVTTRSFTPARPRAVVNRAVAAKAPAAPKRALKQVAMTRPSSSVFVEPRRKPTPTPTGKRGANRKYAS